MSSHVLQNWLCRHTYSLVRPLLFQIEAETAHELTIKFLKYGLGPKINNDYGTLLYTKICGLNFSNPVGLAAGFDKNAEVVGPALNFGFGFVELGSITPYPQAGNPKPRLFRDPKNQAAINRYGFNSDGSTKCLERIIAYQANGKQRGLVGINIGKNKTSTDAVTDYVTGIDKFAPYADYLTVNISSPNTLGLRDLQGREQLLELLKQVLTVRNRATQKPPIFVKVAPDQTEQQQDDIAEVALNSGIDGIIIGNTTITRPDYISPQLAQETGGLSGKPLFTLSTQILANLYKKTNGKIPLIGCGGISNAEDAYTKIRAGASLVQLYTALVYQGPALIDRINHGLVRLLKRDGLKSIQEAIGIDHQ